MVRILQYDPKISAEVYSRRRAAEQPFESPVAAGLGQLGRALMAREERRAPGHQDKTMAMTVLGRMRKEEFARLKKQGAYRTLEQRWSAKGHLEEYLKRRDDGIAALAKENPRAAKIVAERSAILTEDLSRRAMVIESDHSGQALVTDINTAVGDAIETVRTDPTQLGAVLSEFHATLTGLSEDGMDSNATGTIIGAAEQKIATAAFLQRVKEDPGAAKEELKAGEFGDALLPEKAEALMAKADHGIKVRQRQSEAAAKSGEDLFRAELRAYGQRLLDGEVPDDETFGDEAIKARVSPEVAVRLIRERDRAEARGNAFAEIQLMSEAEIKERLGDAERDEVRHLLWARGHRRELIKQGPAAFALRDPVVREAHERWLQARANGDAVAADEAGPAYANAALALQRRMGLSASEQGVLTAEMAAEQVRQSELPDGPDAAALGTMLREELGEHWRVALEDLERAGLSEQVAIIAGLDRPGQQPAARQLAGLVGTRTSDLRESAGDAAAAIDHLLGITIGGAQGAPGDHAIGADTSRGELVRRRAYALAAEGWAPNRAVQRAIEDLSVVNSTQSGGPEALSLEALAESQGIHPSALGAGGVAVRSILERFTRHYDLSDDERDELKNDIRQLDGEHEGHSALRDRAVDLENASGFFAPADEPVGPEPVRSPFAASFEEFLAAGGRTGPAVVDPIFNRLRGQLITTHRETGDLNRAWVNDALIGGDVRQREFAALFLSEMGGAKPLQEVLSETARDAYLEYWNEQFAQEDRIDVGPGRPADSRLTAIVRTGFDDPNWSLPIDQTSDLLVEISRSLSATDRQRQALMDHIGRVITPFHPGIGVDLQEAVGALSVGEKRIDEVPGRFLYLLSHEELVKAARLRGIVIPGKGNDKPEAPPGLLTDPGVLLGSAGVGTSLAGLAFVASPPGLVAALAGLTISGVGLYMNIDDNNDAHTEYLFLKEFYLRFSNPDVSPGLESSLD